MCGIAGVINLKKEPVLKETIERMLKLMCHRGPDHQGIFNRNNIGLGTARLSIIDLKSGNQPISNENGRVWVVCNGEIYNFIELRNYLRSRGHCFKTGSDTEVIVHAYEEWGEKFVKHLKGMFGLAVVDLEKNFLYLARDIVGEKPLFFTRQLDFFAFASEIKPLLNELPVSREIDPLAIQSFFAFSRPVNNLCAFKEVKKLMPKQLLCLNFNSGDIKIFDYWQPTFLEQKISEKEAGDKLLTLLEDAVKRMLVADVPIGAFLSGGTDSSAMVAVMSQFLNHPVKTFTAIYRDQYISEAKEARQVANLLGTDHHEILICPDDVTRMLPELIDKLEEPFADASFIPTYFVSNMASKSVKVAITGDGGDELFGGYEWYFAWQVLENYKKIPKIFQFGLKRIVDLIPNSLFVRRPRFYHYFSGVKKIMIAADDNDTLSSFFKLTSQEDLIALLSREKAEQLINLRRKIFNKYPRKDNLEKIMLFQFQSLLPELFFTKVDRMSMANSLETRSPLVYQDIVEFAFNLPMSFKVRGKKQKYLLKKIFEKYLPKEIIYRPKKGFSIPFYRWLKEDVKLKNMVENFVFSKEARVRMASFGINSDYVGRQTKKYLKGENKNWTLPWRAICFGLWSQRQ